MASADSDMSVEDTAAPTADVLPLPTEASAAMEANPTDETATISSAKIPGFDVDAAVALEEEKESQIAMEGLLAFADTSGNATGLDIAADEDAQATPSTALETVPQQPAEGTLATQQDRSPPTFPDPELPGLKADAPTTLPAADSTSLIPDATVVKEEVATLPSLSSTDIVVDEATEAAAAPSDEVILNSAPIFSEIAPQSVEQPLPAVSNVVPPLEHVQVKQEAQSASALPNVTENTVAKQAAASLLNRKPQTLTRLAKLKQRVDKDRFDGEAWSELIIDALQKGDLERTRDVYEGFLKAFPDNAAEWIAYAELELSHGNNAKVNQIFSRCLRTSASVRLWHFYLTYIRRTNPIDRSSPERALPARDTITKAFEFSLAHVGSDLDAGVIWHDYLEFLKEGDVSSTWEGQQKMDKMRQTYQRAVCIPLDNVEHIWREYDAFENTLNRATAKKFLQDRSPAYMTARVMSKELQRRSQNLARPAIPQRPEWSSQTDRMRGDAWKDIISYEESDPLELGDPAALRSRVSLVYRKALADLRFYPEIWYMAAAFVMRTGKPDEALVFYRSGMEANPTSLLLNYAYIEFEEGRGNLEECKTAYNNLVDRLTSDTDINIASTKQDIEDALEEKRRVEAQEQATRAQQNHFDETEVVSEEARKQEAESIRKAIEDSRSGKLEELRRLGTNVWIMYMRFARRAESIQAARAIFSRTRRWPHVTWHAFVASAMLELRWNKEPKVAMNVFEVGLKRFPDEVEFVLHYLDFLITTNDEGNARVVFEKTVSKLSPEKAKPLWKRWAEHEYIYGELAAVKQLEARLSETYPNDPPIIRFTDRHSYLDLNDIAAVDLGRQLTISVPQQTGESSTHTTKKPEAVPPAIQPPNFDAPPYQQPYQPGPEMVQPPYGATPQQPPMQPPMFANPPMNYPRGPPSIDGSLDSARRSSRAGGNNRRRRSPSPQRYPSKRAPSPPRVSRHTPPSDFPESIPWMMSQLPSKTVFAPHGPILDAQQVIHALMNAPLPPGPEHSRGRDRSISPRRRMGGPGGPMGDRRRSPDYGPRRRG